MNPSRYIYGVAQVIAISASILMPTQAFGQMLDEPTLQALRSQPTAEVERFAEQWTNSQVAKVGRSKAADILASLVAESPSLVEHATLIRTIGKRIEPEFATAVLSRASKTESSITKGSLLQLLREAKPEHLSSIAAMLDDERSAEDLAEMSKKAPKLREAIANGATGFRVCDVAYR